VTALRWSDIDIGRGTIRVRRSRYYGAESAPKPRGSERTVYLLPAVRKALAAAMPAGSGPTDYVFTNEVTRGPINQGEWAREFWHRPLEALNIRKRKFYATRHTFISIALTAKVNIKWLAEQCGNSVAMIEKHYGRFLAGEAEAQLRLLDPTVGSTADRLVTHKGGRKLRTRKPRFAVSAERPLKKKVVPTGIEPVFPT
jgi:integrase